MKKTEFKRKNENGGKWKIKVLRSDRNEIRFHTSTGTLTVLYKNEAGLKMGYSWANTHCKDACMCVAEEYRRLKLQGA